MRVLEALAFPAVLLIIAGCAGSPSDPGAPSPGASAPAADSPTHCSEATIAYALSQAADNAVPATPDQLAQAPAWIPAPACATVDTISTVWVYPNATKEDFDEMLNLIRAQGVEVDDPTLSTKFMEVYGDDYYVSLASVGYEGTTTQVMIANVR